MSKKNSRTTNTIYNFISSIGGEFITILNHFITRTVFIHTLGKSYLGINGLFSNILSMLSLAEFGVGSAILFKLYDPLAKDDHKRIQVLMKFYKSAYRVIGLLVLAIGLSFIPFLPLLIKDYDKLEALNINAVFIYCLFLLKTVSSYLFFAYRSAIIKADQKSYILSITGYFFSVGTAVLQIILLILFKNYTIYVLVSIIQVITYNIICAVIADRMYPYIKEKTENSLDKKEVKEVFKDCGALFLYKLNSVVLKATDNIVLSLFRGLESVGLYSNYLILYTTIGTIYAKVFNAVSHSLGNLHTDKNKNHEYRVFETVMLVTAILGGTAFAGVFVCADELVLAWIGKEWLIEEPFALLMGFELFTLAFRAALSKYRTTMGLFRQGKWRPLFGVLVNIVASVALVRVWGICGVIAGTIIADWATMMWFDPLIIHKYGFGKNFPVLKYFKKFLIYTLTAVAVAGADWLLCSHFLTGYGWLSVIIHAGICVLTVPGVFVALNIRTKEGRYVFGIIKNYGKKIRKKLRLSKRRSG